MMYVHSFFSSDVSLFVFFFFFSSRRRHTRFDCDWSSDVCSSDLKKLRDVQSAPQRLAAALRRERPERGPATDRRQAIDLILGHLERHGPHLWGHAIRIPRRAGGGLRLVARTNNELESLFHAMKHGERRRSGRKILTQDFEALPPAAALAQNLRHADYVHLV